MTNDSFECALPSRRVDGVLRAIESRAWMFYSDMHEHEVERDLARAVRPEVARWVLFLQNGFEYRWPAGPWDRFPIYNWPLNLLTLGWWERRKEGLLRDWEAHGDVRVWPFLTKSELDAARARPRFLVGSS
jgi:hypothetical protein